jgi:hypothetical protein
MTIHNTTMCRRNISVHLPVAVMRDADNPNQLLGPGCVVTVSSAAATLLGRTPPLRSTGLTPATHRKWHCKTIFMPGPTAGSHESVRGTPQETVANGCGPSPFTIVFFTACRSIPAVQDATSIVPCSQSTSRQDFTSFCALSTRAALLK